MAQAIRLRWPRAGQSGFTPDSAQRAVIEHSDGHLRVLAGPGTGKTSVIVAAVHDRLDHGQPAESMLVLTYGRMAAEELRQRLARGSQVVPVATTFHSLAHRLLHAGAGTDGPRLLAAPQQEAMLREIIASTEHLPPELEAARHSRGLAEQVRAYITGEQARGLFPGAVSAHGDPVAAAAEAIYREYLDILGLAGNTDYADLIRQATELLRTRPPESVRELRTIFVDEYQDTDPSQVELLQALAAHGAQVIAVGDPDQSIYGFRGADADGILRFDEVFAQPSCRTIALNSTRRFGPRIAEVARRVVPNNALGSVPAEQVRQHRHPEPLGDPDGQVAVRLYESETAQAEHIAELLRRVHAGRSEMFADLRLDWSQMAVLVRSGMRDIPALQRALMAAGIPVEIAGDDIPLAASPSVQPLLDVLRVAADADGGLTPERANDLLGSPLCGLDPRQVTLLGRHLRRQASLSGQQPPDPSPQLIVAALRDPDRLAGVDEQIAAPVTRLAAILDLAAQRVDAGWPSSRILDEAWRATTWGQQLRTQALSGGRRGREANMALDALVELFDQAEQSERALEGIVGAKQFLEQLEQQVIPAAPDQQRNWNRNAVRLLTAHRSKGSQWPLVVVAGVQQDLWPDLRARPSLFADPHELPGSPGWRQAQLLEERRLFFVACTRASRALLVTAVKSSADDGPEPSSFVDLVRAGDEIAVTPGRPARPLTPVGVVAGLRRDLADPAMSPRMRQEIWDRLLRLSEATDEHDRAIFPWAAPERWWGHREWSDNERPWFDPEQPLGLSASSVDAYISCPRKWFLEKRVRADSPSSTHMAFGNVLHLCAQAVATGDLDPDEERIGEVLDSVWHAVGYEPGWQERYERQEAQEATRRLLTWMANTPGTFEAAEVPFETQLTLDGDEVVTVRGKADRVDLLDDELVITDYKTGRARITKAEVAEHIQLGLYRWVAELGALGDAGRAVAQLLYIREDPPAKEPEQGARLYLQDTDDVPQWLGPVIAAVAAGIRAESVPARPGPACRNCPVASSCPADPAGQEVRP